MRIEDVELLEPVLNEVLLLEMMKARNLDGRVRMLPFKTFIREKLGESVPINQWMHAKYEKLGARIKRKLLGPGTTPVEVG